MDSKKEATIFPLYMNLQSAGQIKVSSVLDDQDSNRTYDIIQWTLRSLESVFRQYGTSFYSDSVDLYPLLLESLSDKNSLKKAYEIYEKSFATSFIHCHAKVFNRDIFSSNLDRTLIFISGISSLSKENQLFLSHFMRTYSQTPLLVASMEGSLRDLMKSSQIVPSFLDIFVSFQSR